jgi:hypothetical protein
MIFANGKRNNHFFIQHISTEADELFIALKTELTG